MSLLHFLATSKTRRRLLKLLVADELIVSGHQLAKLARATYSLVHSELKNMEREGIVTCRRRGKAHVFQLNRQYEEVKTLKLLLDTPKEISVMNRSVDEVVLKLNLAAYGAPLGVQGATDHELSLEETFVRGCLLSRKDATVARALPVLCATRYDQFDLPKLEYLARVLGVLNVLGFFLELTSLLSKRKALRSFARKLKDHRRKRAEPFFLQQRDNAYEEFLARTNTPAVARTWNFKMNMPLDSFESLFHKYYPEHGVP